MFLHMEFIVFLSMARVIVQIPLQYIDSPRSEYPLQIPLHCKHLIEKAKSNNRNNPVINMILMSFVFIFQKNNAPLPSNLF